MELSDYRKELDEIDSELELLLTKRMKLSREIGHLKKNRGLPVFDSEREKLILEKRSSSAGAFGSNVRAVFETILDESKKIQIEEIQENKD